MIILITVTGVCFAMPTNKDVVKPASPREKNLKWFRGAAKTGFIGKLPMKSPRRLMQTLYIYLFKLYIYSFPLPTKNTVHDPSPQIAT
jgi:hypothetical protein